MIIWFMSILATPQTPDYHCGMRMEENEKEEEEEEEESLHKIPL